MHPKGLWAKSFRSITIFTIATQISREAFVKPVLKSRETSENKEIQNIPFQIVYYHFQDGWSFFEYFESRYLVVWKFWVIPEQ